MITEVENNKRFLSVLALTRGGTWEPIATIEIDSREVVERYLTPLLVRFGYEHCVQSDFPQEPGRD
jgi:hypothetical protein